MAVRPRVAKLELRKWLVDIQLLNILFLVGFFIQNAWNCYVYKSWKQLRVSIIHFLLILGTFFVVCMFWACWSYLYSLSFACDCIWCLPWVYWALAVLCVPGLCPWCGISAVWFGESFSGVLLVVALFSCHFRVAKVTSVKSLGVWDPNISAIRQQTRRGSRIVFDIFEI